MYGYISTQQPTKILSVAAQANFRDRSKQRTDEHVLSGAELHSVLMPQWRSAFGARAACGLA